MECPICLEHMPKKNNYKLDCGHRFHYKCLKMTQKQHFNYFNKFNECPYCRTEYELPISMRLRSYNKQCTIPNTLYDLIKDVSISLSINTKCRSILKCFKYLNPNIVHITYPNHF